MCTEVLILTFLMSPFLPPKREGPWNKRNGPSVAEWQNKLCYIHIVGHYAAIKKDGERFTIDFEGFL